MQMLFSQDFNTDIKKVKEAYNNLKYFECTYDIGVYYNDKLHSSIKMDVKLSDSNYIYHVGKEITALCNNEYILTIDHDLKIIAIGKRKAIEMEPEDYLPNMNDSINYTVVSKKEINGLHTYILQYNTGSILQTTLTIQPETGYISYLEYINREKEEYAWRTFASRKTSIKFTNLKKTEKTPLTFFSINKYVTRVKNEFKANPLYSNYQIIDTTSNP